jgi:hypothetical protein
VLGDTENKEVVRNLLTDIVSRGLNPDSGLLVVIDGAKALDGGGPRCLRTACHRATLRCAL